LSENDPMNNDRLSSLALMYIHRDFSVDLDKVMEKCVSAKTRRTDFGMQNGAFWGVFMGKLNT
jgi:hypothetical protein